MAHHRAATTGRTTRRSILYRSVSDDARRSLVSRCGQIHKAIRDDDDWTRLPDLIGNDDSLLWERNSRGWTALHFAALRADDMPFEWWRWIFERCVVGEEKQEESTSGCLITICDLLDAENDMGQSPWDLFCRQALDPLPWQRTQVKERAKELTAIALRVANSPVLLEQWRMIVSMDDLTTGPTTSEEESWQLLLEFWRRLRFLAHLVSGDARSAIEVEQERLLSVLLARGVDCCPSVLLELVVAIYPHQASAWDQGRLPLHIWAAGRSGRGRILAAACDHAHPSQRTTLTMLSNQQSTNTDRKTLEILLRANAQAAMLPDRRQGRYPLHVALEKNATLLSWPILEPLVQAAPNLLYHCDAARQLPAVGLVSAALITDMEVDCYARMSSCCHGAVWTFMSPRNKQRAIDKARDQLHCRHLTMIYEVLQACPHVLSSCVLV